MSTEYDEAQVETIRNLASSLALKRHDYAVATYDNVECDGFDPVKRSGKLETRVSCASCGAVVLRVPDTDHTDERGRIDK